MSRLLLEVGASALLLEDGASDLLTEEAVAVAYRDEDVFRDIAARLLATDQLEVVPAGSDKQPSEVCLATLITRHASTPRWMTETLSTIPGSSKMRRRKPGERSAGRLPAAGAGAR